MHVFMLLVQLLRRPAQAMEVKRDPTNHYTAAVPVSMLRVFVSIAHNRITCVCHLAAPAAHSQLQG